jgi:hypothetical protein
MEFPRFVYMAPGQVQHSTGGRYRCISVDTPAEYDAYLAQGWSATPLEAIVQAGESAFMSGLNERQAKKLRKVKPWVGLQALQKPAQAPEPAPAVPEVPEDDDAPPTLAELQAQATKLGIKFDGRTSDKTLLAKIDAAMRGPV